MHESAEIRLTKGGVAADNFVRISGKSNVALGIQAAEHPAMVALELEVVLISDREDDTRDLWRSGNSSGNFPHRIVGRNSALQGIERVLDAVSDLIAGLAQFGLDLSGIYARHRARSQYDPGVSDEM